jgi:hypothetical protein
MYQLRVHYPLKSRTASGGTFMDLCGKGYDTEVFDQLSLLMARQEALKAMGVKSKIHKPVIEDD